MNVVPVKLKQILMDCGIDMTQQVGHRPVELLEEYLQAVSAKTAVIEDDYIDRDYIEDYASFYARSFRRYNRKCNRVHFFLNDFSIEEFKSVIADEAKDLAEKLKDSYIGFVVLRPLPRTIVGRTCLKPYSTGGTGRHYPAVCHVEVSLYGFPLAVDCMPFQEQDSNVAACATCALWSALNVVANQFNAVVQSPSHITLRATEHGMSRARIFPNQGMTEEDMAYAIRKSGLDPVVIDFQQTHDLMTANRFLGSVYAYLGMGVPVIAIVAILNKNESVYGYHAVTINGYHLGDRRQTKSASGELMAERIDKIYVHDDQLVPYARIFVNKGDSGLELVSSWNDPCEINWQRRFRLLSVMIPSYHKIRVGYSEVWNVANDFGCSIMAYCSANVAGKVVWEITLQKSKDVKSWIRGLTELERKDKLPVLLEHFPKYLWCIKVRIDEDLAAVFLIDATDPGQGLNVSGMVLFSSSFEGLAKDIRNHSKSAAENILCRACLDN